MDENQVGGKNANLSLKEFDMRLNDYALYKAR